MNYGELKTAVTTWINRSDVPTTDVVALAEAEIRRDVRVIAQETTVTGSLSSGRFAVPADFLDSRQLLIGGKVYAFVPPETYQIEQEMQTTARYFTRIGGYFYVVHGDAEAYSLLYFAAFPALSADADTNWVLTNAQDVYLFGALKHAAVWAKDAAAAQGYEGLYQAAVAKLNGADKASRFAGTLTVRPRIVA